jgi:formate dehydrogenase subunit delta
VVSAPTALAVKMADRANITLAAIARSDGLKFTHTHIEFWLRENMSSPDRLVYMANQIGWFFKSRAPKSVPGIAEHIKKFWDPRMRSAILAHLEKGGAGLDPDVKEAITT